MIETVVIAIVLGYALAEAFWLSDYGKRLHEKMVEDIIRQEKQEKDERQP